MKRTLLLPSLLLLLIGALGYEWTAAPPAGRRPLVFCQAGQIHTLDPAKMTWLQDIRAALALWEGLVQYNPRTLAPMPGVARRWRISDDACRYTFFLRRSARWSNGSPVTAQDFLFAWRRMLHPATAAGYVTMFFHVAGAKAYFDSRARRSQHPVPFSTVGVRALNRRTLRIQLRYPCPYFLSLLAFPPFFPLNPQAMRLFAVRHGRQISYNPRWTRPPHLVTDGPYELTAWRFHQYLALRRNPYYWDRRDVRCRRLRIANYPDAQAAFLAYRSGMVDVLSFLPGNFAPELVRLAQQGRRHDVHYRTVFGTYYYLCNCRHKALADPRVRLALDLALDKRAIVRDITRLPQRPVNVLVPPGTIAGYHSPRGLARNVHQARRLLAAAGYPDGRGLPRLKILTNTAAPMNARIAEAVAAMWRAQLGVRSSITQEESKIFHQDMVQGHFDIASADWYGDYMDPTTWLDLFRTGNPNNLSGFSDARYDALLERAGRTANSTRRFELLRQAETILVEQQMPALPLFQALDGMLYNGRRVGGLNLNVRLITLLKYIHRRRPREVPSRSTQRIGSRSSTCRQRSHDSFGVPT